MSTSMYNPSELCQICRISDYDPKYKTTSVWYEATYVNYMFNEENLIEFTIYDPRLLLHLDFVDLDTEVRIMNEDRINYDSTTSVADEIRLYLWKIPIV